MAATTHTIAVFGDPQEADPTSPDLSPGFQFIVPFLAQTGADAAIGLGDYARVEGFTQAQTDERYATFLSEYDKTGIPRSNTVWVQGNHDCVSTMDRTEWATYFGQPADLHAWGLYQIDGIYVIQLEGWAQGYDGYIGYYGEGDSRNSPQANWLVATLQSLPRDAWVIVADHVPIADSTENATVEAESPLLEALFAKYGVDLVLGGHDHDYRRHMDPTGVPYITDGMAGGPCEATNFVPIDAYDTVVFSGEDYDPNAFGYMTIQFDGTAMHVTAYAAQLGATSMQSFDSFDVSNREAAPTLIGFAPTSGPVGSSVILTGAGFTGASAVSFNGMTATSFSVDSDTQITVTVPTGATSGAIAVTTPGGTATSATSFTVIPAPTLIGFAPTSGPVGSSVTLTGSGLHRRQRGQLQRHGGDQLQRRLRHADHGHRADRRHERRDRSHHPRRHGHQRHELHRHPDDQLHEPRRRRELAGRHPPDGELHAQQRPLLGPVPHLLRRRSQQVVHAQDLRRDGRPDRLPRARHPARDHRRRAPPAASTSTGGPTPRSTPGSCRPRATPSR